MKPYKKYGDFYELTKFVRKHMEQKTHGGPDGLRKFWFDRMVENQNDPWYSCPYSTMIFLSEIFELNNPFLTLKLWPYVVKYFRATYK